jgi:hypothetical protein
MTNLGAAPSNTPFSFPGFSAIVSPMFVKARVCITRRPRKSRREIIMLTESGFIQFNTEDVVCKGGRTAKGSALRRGDGRGWLRRKEAAKGKGERAAELEGKEERGKGGGRREGCVRGEGRGLKGRGERAAYMSLS